ncbi:MULTISPECIES: TauD/TfdA family dioxygenase [Thermomonosporaceae]|uniref:TauD/TfdA family dioxygenase n=1 Tax=Thermomonosporaceae TaxID=2012 RepID=UPI00255A88F5|nr:MULTISPECIES: TauD/TfdA family dioxygenase [Thermomonosporaceae]MDL4775333.1 TauD/TfdA family dioxygenase [Actinomadura xylanilytica]
MKAELPGVNVAQFFEESRLPVVISPKDPGADLLSWVGEHAVAVRELALETGGILFRGFPGTADVEVFQKYCASFPDPLLDYTEQSSPRDKLGDKVYSSTTYPADQVIPFHNANSFGHEFPLNIWFACIRTATKGGRTPVCDTRRVLANLSDETRSKFEDKGILYVRNYYDGMGVPWEETFATESREEAEQFMRDGHIAFRWHTGGSRILETRQVRHAILDHPKTGDKVWFNQAHLFHKASLDERLKPLLRQFDDWRLPRNAFFGDGTPIPDETVHEIFAAYEEAELSFDWEAGDYLMLDNLLTSHARKTFEGTQRLISVAFAELHTDYAPQFAKYGDASLDPMEPADGA